MSVCLRCHEEWDGNGYCKACLLAGIRQARAALEPCNCSEVNGPHRHKVEGG